mmetsp:Transcript_17398/g.25933  ORF Transcript_17398/g.25933 Transcript_17398/m.25933 type:complete len:504 (+) Transcript_17398:288-1799(+)
MTFKEFKFALDQTNVFVTESTAKQLFQKSDLDNSGTIDVTGFEIVLMVYDALHLDKFGLTTFDAFYSFDIDNRESLDETQFIQAIQALKQNQDEDNNALANLFQKKVKARSEKRIDYDDFKRLWCYHVCDPIMELSRLGIEPPAKKANILLRLLHARNRSSSLCDQLFEAIGRLDCIFTDGIPEMRDKVIQLRLEAQRQRYSRKRANEITSKQLQRIAAVHSSQQNKDKRKKKKREQIKQVEQSINSCQIDDNVIEAQKLSRTIQNKMIIDKKEKFSALHSNSVYLAGGDKLTLHDAGIREVPTSIYFGQVERSKLADLIIVDLSGNKLASLPGIDFVFNLSSVRKLNISRNRITHLPIEISNLTSLEILYMEKNSLDYIPKEIGCLKKLVHIDISDNRLASLPHEFCQLLSICTIVAHTNFLDLLPGNIGNLESLESLDVSRNSLTNLPATFSNLGFLKRLEMTHNKVTELPDDMGNLFSLEFIDLSYNRLQVSNTCPTSVL